MQDDTLTRALHDAAVTRAVLVAPAAVNRVGDVLPDALGGGSLLVVADENTDRVAGARVVANLRAAGAKLADPLVLRESPRVKPRVSTAEQVAARIRETGCIPVAVGSGVISDLVKYAAALAGRPYACVATAASMDGYAASGAALLNGSFKETMRCPPPVAVVADLDVVAAAPARMVAWGYGDLAGKVVAGADWMLADALGVEPIAERPFGMVQQSLPEWLGAPERLAARDPAALGGLVSGLLISGFAMQAHGNSRPASGSDHQFSHLWEMENLSVDGEPAAHGACVGIGCVAMLALYEWLLAQSIGPAAIERAIAALPPSADDEEALRREIHAAFGDSPVAASASIEMRAKRDQGSRADRLRRLGSAWPALAAKLGALPSAAEMQRRLRATGGAAHPSALGVSLPKLAADHRRARLIRRRYTVLDVVEDLGLLDEAVEALFAPEGFWGRQSASHTSDGTRGLSPREPANAAR